jgi:hypothetical protein
MHSPLRNFASTTEASWLFQAKKPSEKIVGILDEGSGDTVRNSIQRQRNGQCHPNATPGVLPSPFSKWSSTNRRKSSTGGGIRTHTVVPHQRILSPQRLPFRHAGTRGVLDGLASARHKHTDACGSESIRTARKPDVSAGRSIDRRGDDVRQSRSCPHLGTEPSNRTRETLARTHRRRAIGRAHSPRRRSRAPGTTRHADHPG